MNNLISASILSADMLKLENEVRRLEKNKIDMLHFDVMDGVFVNNITYGLPVLSAIKKITDLILDVHLMIIEPLKYVRKFAENGADIITFHLESESNVLETINEIKSCGVKAGLAIKPGTPADEVYEYLPYLDMLLVMTVEPGFGGQKFMDMTDKIKAIRKYADEHSLSLNIQVDGGIDINTAEIVKKAGANILVSGSFLFKSENMSSVADKMKE